ncbi:MAG TPA: type IX secretion system plug protein domain-containing protein, partial [Bacteroidia bacterium]|nr:type IX secretion system plug protein domain-containing protein [Bacteroidia bacterium]
MKTRLHSWIALFVGFLALQGCPKTESTVGSAETQSGEPAKVMEFTDQVYEPNVRTVQFYRGQDPFSYPILYLGEETRLMLEFDILQPQESRVPDYWIEVVSCDHDWTPSGLLPLEYMDGFSSDRMYDYSPSQNTLIPYIHYRYEFPAQGSQFKKSGNFLLKVFRSGDQDDLLLTRRLIVADHKIGVQPLMGQSRMATDRRRIQRVDFNLQLTHAFPGIFDPRNDLKVYILQNFRWDNAVGGLQPMFTSPDELQYQFDAANNFEGGNEFRLLDIRSTRFKTALIK